MVAIPPAPTEVAQTIGPRLEAATVAHRDAQEVAKKCAARWRQLILEAKDAGIHEQVIANLAGGISRSRVHHIVWQESRRP